jgi:protein-tyrosine phosphatase
MGNICRSPTAHGVFLSKVVDAGLSQHIQVDSAGTHAYHVGEPPDKRAQHSAYSRGYDLSALRARKICSDDCARYDYILVMDRDNLTNVLSMCLKNHRHKVKLFLDFADHLPEKEVPDPYYGGSDGFSYVLDLVEAAADGLLKTIQQTGRF